MAERRVVVTGMGAVTPFGVSVDSFWDKLVEGQAGLSSVTLFDTSDFSVRIGGEVPGFDATEYLDPKLVKRLDRYAQFAMVASAEAFKTSALNLDAESPYRLAVIFGSGIGGMNELEQQFSRLIRKGPSKVSAFTIPKLMVNAASGNISIAYGAKGNSIAVSSACASASHAMGEALTHIRRGVADIVFTGGSTIAGGFIDAATEELASMDLGFPVGDIERANQPLTSVSRGCLLGAIDHSSVIALHSPR